MLLRRRAEFRDGTMSEEAGWLITAATDLVTRSCFSEDPTSVMDRLYCYQRPGGMALRTEKENA